MIKEYIIKIDEDQDKKDIHGGYPLIEPPLELVRCKDCKHYKPYRGPVSGKLLHECEISDLDIDEPDWFCANGERRCEND